MRKDVTEQLALIEVGRAAADPRATERRRAKMSMTARCCRALLAELDRLSEDEGRRAEHLMQLFEASERAFGPAAPLSRRGPLRRSTR
jgi:hypothetical protein